jgi:hypothetical protein
LIVPGAVASVDKSKFLPTYLNFVVVESEALKVSEALSCCNLSDNFLFSWADVDEPKIVVFVPQEDGFSRVISDSGGLGKVPIQELFLSGFSDLVKGGGFKISEVPLISDVTKREEIPKLVKDGRWISPTINQFTLTGVEQGIFRVISLKLAKAVGFKESLFTTSPFLFRNGSGLN